MRCIQKCVEGNLPKYVLYNLKSSEAALRTILGEYESALSILNEVLKEEKQHWLSLIRRSQVYKKVRAKLFSKINLKKPWRIWIYWLCMLQTTCKWSHWNWSSRDWWVSQLAHLLRALQEKTKITLMNNKS